MRLQVVGIYSVNPNFLSNNIFWHLSLPYELGDKIILLKYAEPLIAADSGFAAPSIAHLASIRSGLEASLACPAAAANASHWMAFTKQPA